MLKAERSLAVGCCFAVRALRQEGAHSYQHSDVYTSDQGHGGDLRLRITGAFFVYFTLVPGFNLVMHTEIPRYNPTLDPGEITARLKQLLIPNQIEDNDLDRRILRLDERFRIYSACFPSGLWAPGLAVTQEMRVLTEAYLPLSEIGAAFRRLFTRSLKSYRFFPATAIESSATWLDVLHHLQPLVQEANPGRLLRRLMADNEFRTLFLFRLFLPSQFGGCFARYPVQTRFLRDWLMKSGPQRRIRCLDAACGCGEGTYDLALLLMGAGYLPQNAKIHGVTIAPLEIFAAAHARFPHDPGREEAFRSHIGPILKEGWGESILFAREDLNDKACSAAEDYHIILCNGLLGGPLLNEHEELKRTVTELCARLKRGGILMAADRFHSGWKRLVHDALGKTLVENGLKVLHVGEGIAGVKQ